MKPRPSGRRRTGSGVNPTWRHPAKDLVGMMVKLADEPGGSVTGVLGHFGAAPEDVLLGTVNAGHPGGMLPLPATAPPRSTGNPVHHAARLVEVRVSDEGTEPQGDT